MSLPRRHGLLTLGPVAVVIVGLGSCGGDSSRRAAESRALAESAAVYEEITNQFRKVGETPNLQGPESARYDRDLDVWFVSNVNGAPARKDNNGFISRLRPDGAIYNLKFIEGGKKGVTLHAPKGLAISGDTLWVADIDVARAFNKRTGEVIANVNTRARFLNGAAVGPYGAIYMTDTGVLFDNKGALSHPGPDQVFRITRAGATAELTSRQARGTQRDCLGPEGKAFRDRLLSGQGDLRMEAGTDGAGIAGLRPRTAGWCGRASRRAPGDHQLGRLQPLRAGKGPVQESGGGNRIAG